MTKKENEFLKKWYYGVYLTMLMVQKKYKTDKSKESAHPEAESRNNGK